MNLQNDSGVFAVGVGTIAKGRIRHLSEMPVILTKWQYLSPWEWNVLVDNNGRRDIGPCHVAFVVIILLAATTRRYDLSILGLDIQFRSYEDRKIGFLCYSEL